MTRSLLFLARLLPFAMAPWHLAAQATAAVPPQAPVALMAAPLRFEVIAIRPHHFTGDDPSNRRMQPGGRFVATATTVRTLIRVAFGTDDNRISGAPGWIDNEAFDINATTVDHAEVTTPQQFQQLILSLLQDSFQFRFHREQKDGPVYWLEVNKPGMPGPGLHPSPPASQMNLSSNSNGGRTEMKATKVSMAEVAAALRRPAGRPVEDHTGLAGTFDFQMEWTPEETPDSTLPSLFTVLKEQLGLKLRPTKGTIETLSIDRVERPLSN